MACQAILCSLLIAVVAIDFVRPQSWNDEDANAFCASCSGRSNTRNYYSHPTDCHKYYQCFFHNETYAVGRLNSCPPGTFFIEKFQSCGHEGPQQCQDVCFNETVQLLGCASVPGSCSQFVWCSASTELLCCPPKTRFNANTCGCEEDETCTDVCTLPSPDVPTSIAPPAFISDNRCQDSFGNILTGISGRPDLFGIVDAENGDAIIERPCATGSLFSLEQCSCAEIVAVNPQTQTSEKQCFVYLPFDDDAADHSIHHSASTVVGDASLSNLYSAHGDGSFYFNGGHVELPSTKTYDLQNKASICLFYRCPNGTCPVGGLLSNNNNDQKTSYSVILASEAGNKIRALFKLQYPTNEYEISGTVTASSDGFNQVCVTFESAYAGTGFIKLYVNNQLIGNTTFPYGWTFVANCPFTVGADQIFGGFNGFIDEVLICPHTFSADEVDAHYQGEDKMRQFNLIP